MITRSSLIFQALQIIFSQYVLDLIPQGQMIDQNYQVNLGQNYLTSSLFEYQSLSNQGQISTLNQFMIQMWFKVTQLQLNQDMKLFSLVTSESDTPNFINLQVLLGYDSPQPDYYSPHFIVQTGPYNGYTQLQLNYTTYGPISTIIALQKLIFDSQWIFLTVSFDTMGNDTVVLLKVEFPLWDAYTASVFTLKRNRLAWSFPSTSLITNAIFRGENLCRLAGVISQMVWYSGVAAKDYDRLIDYNQSLILHIKGIPASVDNYINSNVYQGVNLSQVGFFYENASQYAYGFQIPRGLFVDYYGWSYDLTQFVISFWFYPMFDQQYVPPASKQSNQISMVQFTDDNQLPHFQVFLLKAAPTNISIIQAYVCAQVNYVRGSQIQTSNNLCPTNYLIQQGQWSHVAVSLFMTNYNTTFYPQYIQNSAAVTIAINGKIVRTQSSLTAMNYSKITNFILGDQTSNPVLNNDSFAIAGIKLFGTAGMYQGQNKTTSDCMLFTGMQQFCLYCQMNGVLPFSDACKEAQIPSYYQPLLDQNYLQFNCPQGYFWEGTGLVSQCLQISTPQCVRADGNGACTKCQPWGGKLTRGQCSLTYTPTPTLTNCGSRQIATCNVTVVNNQISIYPISCTPGFIGKICQLLGSCGIGCRSCLSNGDCAMCSPGYIYDPTRIPNCQTSCNPPMYYNKLTNTCEKQCLLPYFYTATTRCVKDPYSQEQIVTGTLICTADCSAQYWQLDNEVMCYNGYITQCGRFIDGACSFECTRCYYSNRNQCYQCADGYFYFPPTTTCVVVCPGNSLFPVSDITQNYCLDSCNPGTVQYENYIGNSYCDYNCPQGYYPYKQFCINSTGDLPPSTYFDLKKKQYYDCDPACRQCKINSTFCQECTGGFFLTPLSQCLSMCPVQFPYISSNQQNCNTTCQPGEFVLDQYIFGVRYRACYIIGCQFFIMKNVSFILFQHPTQQSTCLSYCPGGFYQKRGTYNVCPPCPVGCSACYSATQCTNCSNGYFLNGTDCIQDCSPLFNIVPNRTCGNCSTPYFSIIGKSNFCVAKCDSPPDKYVYQLLQSCYMSQPLSSFCSGYFCQPCDPSCLLCQNANNNSCTNCLQGLFYQKVTNTTGYCLSDSQCTQMKNLISMTCDPTCAKNQYINYQYCQTQCSPNQYAINLTCFNNTIPQTYCQSVSIQGTVNYFYQCYPCNSTCQTCMGPSNLQCSSCIAGLYFYKGQCLTACPQNAYWIDSNNTCNFKCLVYYLPEISYCADAIPAGYGFYLKTPTQEQLFKIQCPMGSFPNGTYVAGVVNCTSCDSTCDKCQGTSPTQCYNCSTGYYFLNGSQNTTPQIGTCIGKCPQSQPIADNTNLKCVTSCPKGVFYFQANSSCEFNCPKGTVIFGTSCLLQCPKGTYQINQRCQQCNYICTSCFGSSTSECYACKPSIYLDGSTCTFQCSSIRPWVQKSSGRCVQNCTNLEYTQKDQYSCEVSCQTPYNTYQLNGLKECVLQCYDGSYARQSICVLCSLECKTCFGGTSTQCMSCQSGYYLDGTICSQQCSDINPYYDGINWICQQFCPYPLVTVNDIKQCLQQCPDGYGLYNFECYTTCPVGTYKDPLQQCSICFRDCTECFGPTSKDCTACTETTYLENTTCKDTCSILNPWLGLSDRVCYSKCPQGLYSWNSQKLCVTSCPVATYTFNDFCVEQCLSNSFISGLRQCSICDISCSLCYGAHSSECTQCNPNFYLEGNSCVPQCSSDMFMHDDVSHQCLSKCPKPQYAFYDEQRNRRQCVFNCPLGQYIFEDYQCTEVCPSEYYPTTINLKHTCASCHPYCFFCYDNTSTNCSVCQDGYFQLGLQCFRDQCPNNTYLIQNTYQCYEVCPHGYYLLNQQCVDNCNNYNTINTTYFKAGTVCVKQCPSSSFQLDDECIICDPSCATCFGSSQNECLSCLAGYYNLGTSCQDNCNQTLYYMDTVNHKCSISCPPDTLQIDELRVCQIDCGKERYNYKSNCVQQCPQKTFIYSRLCIDCHKSCASCQDSTFRGCTSCPQGFYLNQGQCMKLCQPPNIYLIVADSVCINRCFHPYLTHEDAHQCVDYCPQEPTIYYQYQDRCLKQCPNGTYQISQDRVCKQCSKECSKCFGSLYTQCIQCSIEYYLDGTRCISSCPQKNRFMDQINNRCQSLCPPQTVTVLNKSMCMTDCPNNTYFLNMVCHDQCPQGYFAYDFYCSPCQSQCRQCFGPLTTQCTSCNNGYFLTQTSCQLQCPSGTLYNLVENTCTKNCGDLALFNHSQCILECPQSTVRWRSQCLITCPDGTYKDVSNFCLQCNQICLTCFGPSVRQCNSCAFEYLLEKTTCVSQCSPTYYAEYLSNQCLKNCPEQAYMNDIAPGGPSCTFACNSPQISDPVTKRCVKQCQHNYYIDHDRCSKCAVECNGCSGPSNTDCNECKEPYGLIMMRCVGQCESGYIMEHNQCIQCDWKCLNCKYQLNRCTQCRGDRLYNQNCECPTGKYSKNGVVKCQACNSQCKSCDSPVYCTSCFHNKIPPLCDCIRYPKQTKEWCLDCQNSFPLIKFSDDLSQIIVNFQTIVGIDTLNPFQPSSRLCREIFREESIFTFGTRAKCSLDLESRTFLAIQLGENATVMIGDKLQFIENQIQDLFDPTCTERIIKFHTTEVLPPDNMLQPHIILNNPSNAISSCYQFNIHQIDNNVSGSRNLTIISWNLISVFPQNNTLFQQIQFQLIQLSSTQKQELVILQQMLKPDYVYKILVAFINILGTHGQEIIKIEVASSIMPQIITNYTANIDIYSGVSNTFYFTVFSYDCFQTHENIIDTYDVLIELSPSQQTSLKVQTQQFILPTLKYDFAFLIPPYNLTLGLQYLITVQLYSIYSPQRKSNLQILFEAKGRPINVSVEHQSVFLGSKNRTLQLSGAAYDPDIQDDIASFYGFSYNWICTNLHTLKPCQTDYNQTITFGDLRQIVIDTLVIPEDVVLGFYLNSTKGSRWRIEVFEVIYHDLYQLTSIPFILPIYSPFNNISQSDVLYFKLGSQQQSRTNNYFFSIQNQKLIDVNVLTESEFKIKVDKDYQPGEIKCYILPGQMSTKFRLFTTIDQQGFDYSITPRTGVSLQTVFKFSLTPVKSVIAQTIYVYDSYADLHQDILNGQLINNIQLLTVRKNIFETDLVSGRKTKNYTLCILIHIKKNGITNFVQRNVTVYPQTFEKGIRDLFYSLKQRYDKEKDLVSVKRLGYLNLALKEISQVGNQSCSGNCFGMGTCRIGDNVCTCDRGFYFDDCSGTYEDIKAYNEFLQKIYVNLLMIGESTDLADYDVFDQIFQIWNTLKKHINPQQITIEIFKINPEIAKKFTSNLLYSLKKKLDELNDFDLNLQKNSYKGFTFSKLSVDQYSQQNFLELMSNFCDQFWQLTSYQNLLIIQKMYPNQTDQIRYVFNQIRQNLLNITSAAISILQQTLLPGDPKVIIQAGSMQIKLLKLNQNQVQQILQKIEINGNLPRQLYEIEQSQYFDYVLTRYEDNPYIYDVSYPYPEQTQPLVKLSIQYDSRKVLINGFNNYSVIFKIEPEDLNFETTRKYICITQSIRYYWSAQDCQTNRTIINQTLRLNCTCSPQGEITYVNDLNYIYVDKLIKYSKYPTLFIHLLFGSMIALALLLWLIGNHLDYMNTHRQTHAIDKASENEITGLKGKGKVLSILKTKSQNFMAHTMKSQVIQEPSTPINFFTQASQKKDKMLRRATTTFRQTESKNNDDEEFIIDSKFNRQQIHKYEFTSFHRFHKVLAIIFKNSKTTPRMIRVQFLLFRWLMIVTMIMVIRIVESDPLAQILYSFVALVGIRSIEYYSLFIFRYLVKNLSNLTMILNILIKLINVTLIAVLWVFLIDLVEDQQIDQINILMITDILIFDLFVFSINRWLGENKKRQLIQRVDEVKIIYKNSLIAREKYRVLQEIEKLKEIVQ